MSPRSWAGKHDARRPRAFLVPVKALAKLMRGKLRAAFQKQRPDLVLPDAVWSKPWVVHCTPWGEGVQAVLDYLARYVFRVAITNTRIVGLDDQAVTIRHKHRKSNRWRISRIPGQQFIRRFLQHVLPKGLHKVRWWHPVRRKDAARARLLLRLPTGPNERRSRRSAKVGQSAGLSLLPQRPSPICPPALPEAGSGTMTREPDLLRQAPGRPCMGRARHEHICFVAANLPACERETKSFAHAPAISNAANDDDGAVGRPRLVPRRRCQRISPD